MADREKNYIADEYSCDHANDDSDDLFFEDDDYLDRLEELSEKIKSSGGMSFFEIDGFLHGIVCNQSPILPSVFLPEIFGEDSEGYLLADGEVREATELILRHYDDLLGMVDGKTFYPDLWISPMMGYEEEEDSDAGEEDNVFDEIAADTVENNWDEHPFRVSDEELKELEADAEQLIEEIIVDETSWARGFIHALSLGGGLERFMPNEPSEELTVLVPVLMLAYNELPVEEDSPEFGKPLTPESRARALQILPACVSEIYQILHSPVKRRKISRNNPCPCGSGKKYKKCCLNKPTR